MIESTRAAFDARYHTLARRGGWFHPSTQVTMLASLARALGPWLPEDRDAAILDVGCGEGSLLTLLRNRGYQKLSAFDVSPENIRLCHQQGFEFVTLCDALSLEAFQPGAAYDAIFLMDLIEHLPKEHALPLLRAARERLRPGGRLIVQTPNLGSVLGVLYRHNDITHEWGVTERSMTDLLGAAGFPPAEVRIVPAWSATRSLGRLRERYLRVLHRMIFLSAGQDRPRIPTPNLIAVGVKR